VLVVAVAVGLVVFAPSAFGGGYVESCGFVFDPPVVDPGGAEVHILGSGFTPGSQVEFFIDGESLGTATVSNDTDGNIDVTFPLPEAFDIDGEYTITAECPDGAVATNVLIVGLGFVTTTTAPPTTVVSPTSIPQQPLPVTGSDSGDLVRVGLGLLVVGGGVLAVSRRRAHHVATGV
jgi:LPXTG-motif cell wall-anchored protein